MTVISRSDLAAAIMLITLWFGVVIPAQSAEPASSAVTETPMTKPDAVALEVWPTVGQARLKNIILECVRLSFIDPDWDLAG